MNSCMRKRWWILLIAMTAQAALAQAPRDAAAEMQESRDSGAERIEELPLALPAPPKDADLIRINTGQPTAMKYYIDAASVAYGRDRIVRYTVVAEGDRGVRNVWYEGMRCDSRSRKVYAYGRPDGSWAAASRAEWVRFDTTDIYRIALHREYFCPVAMNVRSAAEAVDVLRRGVNPAVTDPTSPEQPRRR